jgi:hypothetical protein
MPFAQDSDLELLFNPALISTEVRNALHSDLHVRPSAPFSLPNSNSTMVRGWETDTTA